MLVLRLRARLLLSYAVVTALLVAAFSQMAVGLMHTHEVVASVGQEELASFEREQRVYVAAWALELAVRRGVVACEQHDGSAASVHRAVASARQALQSALGAGTEQLDAGFRASAQDYVQYALQLEEAGTCESMLSFPLRERRLQLDEVLTTVWSERTRDMRLAIQAKEDHARAIGSASLRSGGLFGLLGILAAGALAFGQARAVSNSVALLSTHARRIGQGDFSPLPPLRGPEELRALSLDLDRMRGRLAELDQLKSAFVASVSHDLRTPLARVREALSLLGDGSTGPLTPQQARVVKLAQAACEREIRMVTSVLDLSRVQSGQPLQRNAGASVEQIVQNVLQDLAFEADERKVQLVFEPASKPVRAPMDTALVERALSNLVSNAIAVSSAGKTVRISCELVSRKRPGAPSPVSAVQLSVADQGPGVPAHAREWIFRPFASLEVGGRRSTGLGLAIAREMITAHGGELSLADTPGPGATFIFWIPLEDPATPGGRLDA